MWGSALGKPNTFPSISKHIPLPVPLLALWYLGSDCKWMMWAALVLWASPREQLFTPWNKTSASRCRTALKFSWGVHSGGL